MLCRFGCGVHDSGHPGTHGGAVPVGHDVDGQFGVIEQVGVAAVLWVALEVGLADAGLAGPVLGPSELLAAHLVLHLALEGAQAGHRVLGPAQASVRVREVAAGQEHRLDDLLVDEELRRCHVLARVLTDPRVVSGEHPLELTGGVAAGPGGELEVQWGQFACGGALVDQLLDGAVATGSVQGGLIAHRVLLGRVKGVVNSSRAGLPGERNREARGS